MTTQPQFPNPGTQAPDRSSRRVADRLTAPNPSSRRPRRTCPEPVGGACPEPVEGGPSSNQHPRPAALPRQSVPASPPSPRLPTRPSHLVRTAPSTAPDWPKSDAPRPQEFFGKELTYMSAHDAWSQRQVMPVGRMNMTPDEIQQFKILLDDCSQSRLLQLINKFRKFLHLLRPL